MPDLNLARNSRLYPWNKHEIRIHIVEIQGVKTTVTKNTKTSLVEESLEEAEVRVYSLILKMNLTKRTINLLFK